MKKAAILVLCFILLLFATASAEALTTAELAEQIAGKLNCIDEIRTADALDGSIDRVLWTDNRVNANCSLLMYAGEADALNAAISNATASTMVRSAGAYNLYLGNDLTREQADEYEAALREALGLEAQETPDYILNVNTHKFHAPNCTSVEKIKDSNRFDYSGDRALLIEHEYEACKICKP